MNFLASAQGWHASHTAIVAPVEEAMMTTRSPIFFAHAKATHVSQKGFSRRIVAHRQTSALERPQAVTGEPIAQQVPLE